MDHRGREQPRLQSNMSLPITILLTTLRLCSFGSFVWLLGLALSGSISLMLTAVSSIMFVLDGGVARWLRSLPNDTEVSKVMKRFCMIGQASMLLCTILCLPFYTSVPWVRAGFLMIVSPVVAIGFCQDAGEAFRMLFAMFVMVAYCESEPAFVLCLLVEDSWLVFSTWKGAQLIETTQREAQGVRNYYEHVKKILTVLLDCTLVVEDATNISSPAETASNPDLKVWRVRGSEPMVDHFFGVPMQSTDVLEMMSSDEDRDRVGEALHEAAQEEHPVARLISNVQVRCSALAGGAAAATTSSTSHGKQFIEVCADLIVVGTGTRAHRDNVQRAAACIGVRVAEKAGDGSCADETIAELFPSAQSTVVTQTGLAESPEDSVAQQGEGCESDDSASSASATEPLSTTLFPQAHSVSMVVQADSERMSITCMTLHFSRMSRPHLLDWLSVDDAQQTVMWIERNMNIMWSDPSVTRSTGHGPLRLCCGSRVFVVASDAALERADSAHRHSPALPAPGVGGGEELQQQQQEDDLGSVDLHSDGESPFSRCSIHLQGISQCFWPPWVVTHGLRRLRRRRHDQPSYSRR